jgi:ribosome biogenesis GTPase A
MITEQSAAVDVICEVIDARIPASSRNPDLAELTANKPRVVVLNRVDLADPTATSKWADSLKRNARVVLCDAKSGKGVETFERAVRDAFSVKLQRLSERGIEGAAVRVMVVGIPNAGKSTLINRLARRKAAVTADRPGVTRGRQWVTVSKSLELLDTPGILWPKIETERQSENLALTGAIRDAVLDTEELAVTLCDRLALSYPQLLMARYKLQSTDGGGLAILTECARRRGFLMSGGVVDTLRMANVILDEFRGGVIGRITLESEVPL